MDAVPNTDALSDIEEAARDIEDAVPDVESSTPVLVQENVESYTLQDIGRSIQEYKWYTKTVVCGVIVGGVAWLLYNKKTPQRADKDTSPVQAGPTAAAQTTPAPITTRPSLYKKTPDPFKMD